MSNTRILVVDDDPSALSTLAELLELEGYEVSRAAGGPEAIALMEQQPFDLVLTDLRMREMDGLMVLQSSRSLRPEVPVIVMTAFASMETTIDAIRKGAYDYISKPFKLDHVRVVIRRALEQAKLARENRELRVAVSKRRTDKRLIGQSPEMVEIYKLIARVAPLQTTVLIQGESGTGKEMVARLIHVTSDRREGPFVAVNCGALTETLLESELFGYMKGAFTGAAANKAGLFEAAHGGTIFLDEISTTTTALQMKLLRVLEEKEVLRVGSTEPLSVDVRIITASNQNLDNLVKEGNFREDLYYRLKVVTIDLPPLRRRRGDIPLLIEYFIQQSAHATGKTLAVHDSVYPLLARYAWPGNVRELENILERAVALNSSGILTPEDFPEEIRKCGPAISSVEAAVGTPRAFQTLAERERDYVLEVLAAAGDNASRAAEILDIDRRTLYRILERHGIRRG
jgi:two-component system response regulator AtoC